MRRESLAVEFRVEGDDCPLAAASRAADCPIDARPPLLRRDGNALLRFSAPTGGRLPAALDDDDRIRYLYVSRGEDRDDFRCLSKAPCVVHDLVDAGFLADSLHYRDGVGTFTGAVVGHAVLQGVVDTASEAVGVRIERLYPLDDEGGGSVATRWDVTPRQEEAIETALSMGYFAVPREVTAADVAAELGISKSAFLERLHRGQQTLFAQQFDGSAGADDGPG
ncbi:MAG: helix-turn-helix domain-containing protein [Haloferacaceae archaeon]